ncbi:hypothetical protein COPCOM_03705 [Coprococcus comes ATCC 27758]|uniref:Uncharacterized protein n=1 Tax=Coprococcus comes ATCC 27758 TaxID=470146 RepID=C0BEU3_9FIRM|nr:hypothetical protein COPCOM_03705 [Coprococcus comes ATCC 27758]
MNVRLFRRKKHDRCRTKRGCPSICKPMDGKKGKKMKMDVLIGLIY